MITIKNLTYNYTKSKRLFNGLNLEITPGKIYGLLGKNGAGKSSLMKIIAGLLYPAKGSCITDVFEAKKREARFLLEIFFIPEEYYLPSLSITQFIKLYAPFYPNFNKEQFLYYLNEFGIEEDSHLLKLSFGQKKKALISFGVATNTSLLIMDEPTNGLDIPSKIEFRNIVAKINLENKIIMISTHQVKDLDNLVDTIIIMDKSQILLHEDAERITSQLHFETVTEVPKQVEILYAEPVHNGYAIITAAKDHQPSYLDIEVLFNATISGTNLLNNKSLK